MTPTSDEFKFDVAFSLLTRDAELAQALADQLAPLRCFVFTREQRNLVGRNGVEAFAEVFRRDTRLAVILHRSGYGETEYTDLEVRGIQDRAMATRWQSPLLLKLDNAPPPNWLPSRNIWLDLTRYPIEEAVGAIRLRAADLGAQSRIESAAEYLERLATRKADEERRTDHQQSRQGMNEVAEEVKTLLSDLERAFEAAGPLLQPSSPHWIPSQSGAVIATRNGSLVVEWILEYSNSLSGAGLYVKMYDGYVSGGGRVAARAPNLLSDVAYTPRYDRGGIWRWVPDNRKDPVTTSELTEELMKQLTAVVFGDIQRSTRASRGRAT